MKYHLQVICFALLAACASTSTTVVPKTFTQLINDAAVVNDGIVQVSTTMLNSQLISSAQAKKILAFTDDVNAAITSANAAYIAGNTVLANAKLSAVTATLTSVQSCTTAPNPAVTLTACLAPIGAP